MRWDGQPSRYCCEKVKIKAVIAIQSKCGGGWCAEATQCSGQEGPMGAINSITRFDHCFDLLPRAEAPSSHSNKTHFPTLPPSLPPSLPQLSSTEKAERWGWAEIKGTTSHLSESDCVTNDNKHVMLLNQMEIVRVKDSFNTTRQNLLEKHTKMEDFKIVKEIPTHTNISKSTPSHRPPNLRRLRATSHNRNQTTREGNHQFEDCTIICARFRSWEHQRSAAPSQQRASACYTCPKHLAFEKKWLRPEVNWTRLNKWHARNEMNVDIAAQARPLPFNQWNYQVAIA